jgi:hypothetical protein
MATFETPGYRSTLTPEGRKIIQIPLSVTDDDAPSMPTVPDGTRLVSREYTRRPDGGRDYVFTYESNGSEPGDAQIQVNGQAAQEPIETHPSFNGEGPDGEGPDGEGPDGEGPDGEGPDIELPGGGGELAASGLFTGKVSDLFDYTKLTPSQLAKLLPLIDYVAKLKQDTKRA